MRVEVAVRLIPQYLKAAVDWPGYDPDDDLDRTTTINDAGALDDYRREGIVAHIYFSTTGAWAELYSGMIVWTGTSTEAPIVLDDGKGKVAKHAGPIHPGTGTDQSVHGRKGRQAKRLYHVTAKGNRDSILDDGIRLSDVDDQHVWTFDNLEAAIRYAGGQKFWNDIDIWEIDPGPVDGRKPIEQFGEFHPGVDDPGDYAATSVLHSMVAPGRLTLIDDWWMRRSLSPKLAVGDLKPYAKHAGPIHPGTGTDQSVHGSGGGGTATIRKAPSWKSLNRLRPNTNAVIAEQLIPERKGSMETLRVAQKDWNVRNLGARLSGNEDFQSFVENDGANMALVSHAADVGFEGERRYGDDGLDYIDTYLDSWASMHERNTERINDAIGRVFGIPYGPTENLTPRQLADNALVEAMYDETQAFLADGPDEYVFFRGLRGNHYSGDLNDSLDEWTLRLDDHWQKTESGSYGDFPGLIYTDAMLKGRPGASWSASYSTAKGFAQNGVILAVAVPKEAILSTAQTGLGALFEDEVILVDKGDNVVTVLSGEQTERSFNIMKEDFLSHAEPNAYGGVEFPAAYNDKNHKLGWSNAVLDSFYKRGLWVDTMEDPRAVDDSEIGEMSDRYRP